MSFCEKSFPRLDSAKLAEQVCGFCLGQGTVPKELQDELFQLFEKLRRVVSGYDFPPHNLKLLEVILRGISPANPLWWSPKVLLESKAEVSGQRTSVGQCVRFGNQGDCGGFPRW